MRSERVPPPLRSRVLPGLALGDALGAPVEGLARGEIRRLHGRVTGFLGPPRLTDDTRLALLTARGLLRDRGVDPPAMACRLVEEAHRIPRLGPTTTHAIRQLSRNPRWRARGGATNGAAARCLPIGILHTDPGRVMEETARAARLTHGTDAAIASACAIACGISTGIEEGPGAAVEAALQGARRGAHHGTRTRHPSVHRQIQRALDTPIPRLPETIGVGLPAWEAIPTAIAIFAHSPRPLQDAVNLGGDTDTTAALAGALLGAASPRRLPRGLLARVPRLRELEGVESRLLLQRQ